MTNPTERICAHCGSVYSLVYTYSDGRKQTLNTTFCSKSCAAQAGAASGKGCIKPDLGRDVLKEKAISFIHGQNSYCTMSDICTGIKSSSKTLVKHGLKVRELNEEAGFTKPKSKFQESVGNILADSFPGVKEEVTFDGLVGSTGHPLKVDFYIPELNVVVEADGSQHRYPDHPWHTANHNGTVQEYDEIKNKFFAEQGIPLVRVPYKRNLKKSDVLDKLD